MTTMETKTCATCGRQYHNEADFLSRTSRWRRCDLGHLWFNCDCGSTLIIKNGKYSWYSPDKFMTGEAAGVFNRLGGLKELPYFPSKLIELQELISRPDYEPDVVAKAIRDEPFVAANVLQIAQNLRMARNPDTPPIQSLSHAVVYIDKTPLTDVITSAALRTFKLPESHFNEELFWYESYLIGAIGESLVEQLKPSVDKDEVYIAGTLANIGKLVTAICFPDIASKVSDDVNDLKKMPTWRIAEKSHEFPEHTILGEVASSMWGLPTYVLNTVRHHHTKLDTPESRIPLVPLVGLANQLAHWIIGQPSRIEEDLMVQYRDHFGLTQKDLDNVVNELLPLRERIEYKVR